MIHKILVLLVAALFLSPLLARAEEQTTTWLGLTGLYTLPTAESAHAGTIMLNYSEVRFAEQNANKLEDVWFTGGVTYAPSSRLELAMLWRNEQVSWGPTDMPNYTQVDCKALYLGDVKYQLVRPDTCKLGLAFGVIDVGNVTRNIDGLDTGRGRRYFLVGTYKWADLAITEDFHGMGAVAGGCLPLTNSIDLLAEFSTKPVFVLVPPRPQDHANFNLGIRVYPPQVPELHFDIAAVGDGEFDFGFALGYNF